MAIRSKPTGTPIADERAVQAFIEKGGGAAPERQSAEKLKRHQLRLPPSLIGRIDRMRDYRTVQPSRHDWFLEAILEKLERDEQALTKREQLRAS
jgi:hypothetical protein